MWLLKKIEKWLENVYNNMTLPEGIILFMIKALDNKNLTMEDLNAINAIAVRNNCLKIIAWCEQRSKTIGIDD